MLSAIGDGAVKCNLITFGADQIHDSIFTSRYFDKFVVIINIANILEELLRIYILSEEHYFLLYIISVSNLYIAALLFILGWKFYIHIKPYDSVLSNCFPVYKNAFQTWWKYKKNKHSLDQNNLRREEIDEQSLKIVDFAKVINNGKYLDRIVDDVKSLQKAVITCVLILPYWFIFTQVKII